MRDYFAEEIESVDAPEKDYFSEEIGGVKTAVQTPARKDLLDTMAGISPEELISKGALKTAAIQQAGKDIFSIPASYTNTMLLNTPKSILETLTPYKYPAPDLMEKTNSPVTGTLAKIMGAKGFIDSPILKALTLKSPVAEGMIAPKAAGVLGEMGVNMTPEVARTLTGMSIGMAFAPDNFADMYSRTLNTITGGWLGKYEPTIIAGMESFAKAVPELTKNAGAWIDNYLIKSLPKDFRFGKNAGRGIADAGITANSFEELYNKVGTSIKKTVDDLALVLKGPEAKSKKINLRAALKPLYDLRAEAMVSPESNESLVTMIDKRISDLTQRSTLRISSPEQALAFKQQVGNLVKWDGTSNTNKVNKALRSVYHNARTALEDAVPASKGLNQSLADLITARHAVEKRVADSQVARLGLGVRDAVKIGTGIATGSAFHSTPIGIATLVGEYGIEAALKTPAIATRLAKGLFSIGKTEQDILFKKIPGLAQAIVSKYSSIKNFIDTYGARDVKLIRPTGDQSMLDTIQASISERMRNDLLSRAGLEAEIPNVTKPTDTSLYLSDVMGNNRGRALIPFGIGEASSKVTSPSSLAKLFPLVDEYGGQIDKISYNPKTGKSYASYGSEMHARAIPKTDRFDDYVRLILDHDNKVVGTRTFGDRAADLSDPDIAAKFRAKSYDAQMDAIEAFQSEHPNWRGLMNVGSNLGVAEELNVKNLSMENLRDLVLSPNDKKVTYFHEYLTPKDDALSPAIQERLSGYMHSFFVDDRGNSIIAKAVGLPEVRIVKSSGGWEGKIRPNVSMEVKGLVSSDGILDVKKVEKLATALGYVNSQDAILYTKPSINGRRVAGDMNFGRALTKQEKVTLGKSLQKNGLFAFSESPNGDIIIVDYPSDPSKALTEKELHDILDRVGNEVAGKHGIQQYITDVGRDDGNLVFGGKHGEVYTRSFTQAERRQVDALKNNADKARAAFYTDHVKGKKVGTPQTISK